MSYAKALVIYLLLTCIYICVCTCMLHFSCGCQRTTGGVLFFPPIRVLGVKLRPSGVLENVLVTQLSYQPAAFFSETGSLSEPGTWHFDWIAGPLSALTCICLPPLCITRVTDTGPALFLHRARDLNSNLHPRWAGTLPIEHRLDRYGGGVLFCFVKPFYCVCKTKSGPCLGVVGNPRRSAGMRDPVHRGRKKEVCP